MRLKGVNLPKVTPFMVFIKEGKTRMKLIKFTTWRVISYVFLKEELVSLIFICRDSLR